jgi:hypothetical protein
MVYKIEKDENGNVRNAKGERFMLSECRVAYTPQGVNYGYMFFPTRSAALAFYGVEDIPEEEMFPPPVEA